LSNTFLVVQYEVIPAYVCQTCFSNDFSFLPPLYRDAHLSYIKGVMTLILYNYFQVQVSLFLEHI